MRPSIIPSSAPVLHEVELRDRVRLHPEHLATLTHERDRFAGELESIALHLGVNTDREDFGEVIADIHAKLAVLLPVSSEVQPNE
jgi:hypothetical protein